MSSGLLQNLVSEQESLEDFINKKLSSKLWRLNNLYKIRDKHGKLITLKLNKSQEIILTKFRHNKKIILKSRQQGVSTLKLAYNLDSCIFHQGYSAGIQSYGNDESKKLQRKAELMWNEFDKDLKKLLNISLTMNNSTGMGFSNGSILKIGNFRGDTLQSLHVSELAKIAKKYPEKANELATGAFQAIATGSKITIESTAEGKFGLFYDMWQKAVNVQKIRPNLTPLDFEPIFIPWTIDDDCNLEMDVDFSPEILEYFEKLKARNIELTRTQRNWYQAKYNEIGWLIKQEYPTTAEEAFEKSLEGTYYEHEYKTLKIIPEDKIYVGNNIVHTAVDIGMNDMFVILFFIIDSEGPVIIDEFEDNGHGLQYYRDKYDAYAVKYGWKYGMMYCPHDVKVKELTSDKTRYEVLKELNFNPIIVKKHSLQDGIEITRRMLKKIRISSKCENIIAAIQGYRKHYDEKLGVFLEKPVHDKLSHRADALRYLSIGLKHRMPNYNNYLDDEVIVADSKDIYTLNGFEV